MTAPEYHFVSEWRLPATQIAEAAAIIAEPLDLPRWWPSVYLAVSELRAGDEHGVGREVDLYTKGWLPYTLRWQFTVSEVDLPHRIAIEALAEPSELAAAAAVQRQPPLGDGARRAEPAHRT
jgi:hypothetical protein